jgi:hypothetical protein
VTDPSSRTLLDDRRVKGTFGTARATAFHLGVIVYRKRESGKIVGALPQLDHGVWAAKNFRPWQWSGWTIPRSHGRLKPVYDSLRLLWQEAPAAAPTRPAR